MAEITKNQLKRIWEHIDKTNTELGDVQKDVASIKTDITWIKYLVGANLIAIISLVFKFLLG